MKNIIFPCPKYNIGDEFEIKDKYQTPYYRKGIKYIIDDITYSMANDEWQVTLYYYRDSTDTDFSYVGLDELVRSFNKIQNEV